MLTDSGGNLVAAMETNTAILSEVLRVLVDMQGTLRVVATTLATSQLNRSQPAQVRSLDAGQDIRNDAEKPSESKVVRMDRADNEINSVDHKALLADSTHRNIEELPAMDRKSVRVQDELCAFDALEAFSADTTAAIAVDDLVATTRALGLEPAFVNFVGEELNHKGIGLLFDEHRVTTGSIPFDEFHKAMTVLSQHRSKMNSESAVGRDIVGEDGRRFSLGADSALSATSQALAVRDGTSDDYVMGSREGSLRRSSVITTHSLGEVSEAVRKLECVVLEPLGKQVDRRNYVTTGCVVCLHCMPPSHEILEQLEQGLRNAGWLDLGISIALPNLQMSAAMRQEDFEAVVEAALRLLEFHRCILVGVGSGAEHAAELASSERLRGQVDGVILVSPGSLTSPAACASLQCPVLLSWPLDDDGLFSEDAEVWLWALDERCAPTMVLALEFGCHRLDQLLEDNTAASRLRNFAIAALLLAALEDELPEDETLRLQRVMRLRQELPDFLRSDGDVDEDSDDEGTRDDSESGRLALTPWEKVQAACFTRLTGALPQWIQAGVPSSTE